MRRSLFAAALIASLATSAFLAPAGAWARGPVTPAANLEQLNHDFRALYRERTQQVLEALALVLVVQNSTVTAVRGTHRRLYPVPLQRYNEARAIVHAALGFHGLMNSLAHASDAHAGGTTDWQRAHAFRSALQQTERSIAGSQLPASEKAQAREVLSILDAAAAEAITAQSITPAAIASTMQRTESLLSDMAESIGRAHAQALQAALHQAKAHATEEEWRQAVAVVTGPMTPRRNNLETAAVAAVLGSEHLGTRIFYAENIFSVDGALSYLQTLVGDRELSLQVFGEPHRMWEDLFAPVSRELVAEEFYTELAE